MLARKYGQSPDGAQQMQDRVEAVAAEEGLVYRLSQTLHLNTVDAHRLIHLAHEQGGNELQGRVKEALLAAYFTEGRNVADHAVLRDVARPRASTPPGSRRCSAPASSRPTCTPTSRRPRPTAPAVSRSSSSTRSTASPGRSRREVFTQVLEQAWAESRPKIEVLATGADGQECGPDGCAI